MPLLRRQPFIKEPIPEDFDPDEGLFHCKLTNEVFRDYEAFFERVILCNSLLWTCEMTGRPGLTYLEATQNEARARAAIAAMPSPLKRAMLFLACCARRHRLKDLRDDVVGYMRERFFAGEEVDAVVNGERRLCEVMKVIAPHSTINGNSQQNSDDSDNDCVEIEFHPSDFQYQVRIVNSSKGTTHLVTAADLMRRKGAFTRDKCKLFLKHACSLTNGTYLAKERFVEKYGLLKLKFSDIFAGQMPHFDDKKRRSTQKSKTTIVKEKLDNHRSSSSTKKKKKKKKSSSKDRENSNKEEEKHKRVEEQRRLKKVEKDKEREERRIMAESLREWQKPRDDLECDDLLDLPTPVPVVTTVPNHLFGDVLALLEFMHDFSEVLAIKERFPPGVTLDVVERALVESDVQGPLNDLLQMLLKSLFGVVDDDDIVNSGECLNSVVGSSNANGAVVEREHKDDDGLSTSVSKEDTDLRTAVAAANSPMQIHGLRLPRISLDPFTLSEVLRLHLLSSGIRSGSSISYVNRDDPGRQFRFDEEALLNTLKYKLVFDLPPGDKLKILMCLIGQLLTFNAFRVDVEDNIERLRLARYEFKTFQWSEQRREREEAALRVKKNQEKEETAAIEAANENLEPAAAKKSIVNENDDVELDKREAKRRLDGSKREREFIELINKLQSRHVVQPLGHDRAHRRFWMFNATPGLFVEDDDGLVGPCMQRPTPSNPNSNPYVTFNQSMSDKENAAALLQLSVNFTSSMMTQNLAKTPKLLVDNRVNGLNGFSTDGGVGVGVALRKSSRVSSQDAVTSEKKSGQVFGMCNALGDRCPVHGSSRRRRPKWSFFPSGAHVESLISSLNPRGFREGNLKEVLVAEKKRVLQSVSRCSVTKLNPELGGLVVDDDRSRTDESKDARKSNRRLSSSTSSSASGVNTNDGDSKVVDGLPSEKINRSEDFLNLTLRGSLLELEEKLYAGGLGSIKVDDREDWRERIASYDPDTIDEEERDSKSAVAELAAILLQIFRGIETKYIIPPLGPGGSSDAERNCCRSLATRWQESLMTCTSLSQIFIHLATLDRSIAWSRSVLNARCRICRRKGDAEHMLLCDGCDKGHHMYCLKPPLQMIPEGDWMCYDCRPKPKVSASKKRKVKFIKQAAEEEVDEEDVDVEFEDDENVTNKDSATTAKGIRVNKRQKQETCNACHKNGQLISCCDCRVAYHMACTLPPLKKLPRGKWTCSDCAESVQLKTRNNSPSLNSGKRTSTESSKNSPDNPRRSERRVKRVLDYSKHSRESSDEDESVMKSSITKRSRRSPPSEDVPDEEWYGLVRRSMPSVNRRGASDDVPLDFRTCDRLLTDLVRHDQGWPFLRPVTRKEVPAYYEIVKRPVDFGRIRSRLNQMIYPSNAAFVADVMLVFQNCCVINPASGPEYRAAECLGRYFLKRLRELRLGQPHEREHEVKGFDIKKNIYCERDSDEDDVEETEEESVSEEDLDVDDDWDSDLSV